MLAPITRYCVKHSVKLQDIIETVKISCVSEAKQELAKQEKKVTAAALSAVTGIHRKDVARIFKRKEPRKQGPSLITRVLGQWQADKRFTTKKGKPKTLSVGSAQSEFNILVQSVSVDVHSRTILEELVRIGAVQKSAQRVKLIKTLFMPRGQKKESYQMLSRDVKDLIYAVEENISSEDSLPHFHIRTEFDNVDIDELLNIKKWVLEQGDGFHTRMMKHLGQFDKDVNNKLAKKPCGGRVAVVGFGFTQKPS